MSHCTTFKFQYTNRKLITKSFEQLGLEWKDDIIYSYASSYDKERGIIQRKMPAICAEKKDFNYFMCNEGNHYVLSVEKHNMNWKEETYAKKLGTEFQKTYIEEVAKNFIEQMTQNGTNCLLYKEDNGYVIRFGSMYEKSILIKFENGRVIEEVQGVKGKSCKSVTEALENMLSTEDTALNTEWTSEYYEDSGEGLSIYNLEQF